ncbi:MAG: hypothetical protein KBA15_04775 [Spirochaetes bacterium]|jgi:hypothetical protein|nr:hypothetical protein [Spirochaetota bacterium]
MKQRPSRFFPALLPLLAAAVVTGLYCAKEVKKPVQPDICPPTIGTGPRVEFEKEGFISADLYRIVIVEPEGGAEIAAAEKTARMRALSSLQKYLQSKDMVVDQNVTARLLALIDESGRLGRSTSNGGGRCVYYFDIERPRLADYVLSISRKR